MEGLYFGDPLPPLGEITAGDYRPCNHQWFEIGKVVKTVDAPDLPPSAYHQVIGVKVQCAMCFEVRELTGNKENDEQNN